jgi:hypothetical protein
MVTGSAASELIDRTRKLLLTFIVLKPDRLCLFGYSPKKETKKAAATEEPLKNQNIRLKSANSLRSNSADFLAANALIFFNGVLRRRVVSS